MVHAIIINTAVARREAPRSSARKAGKSVIVASAIMKRTIKLPEPGYQNLKKRRNVKIENE